MDRNRGEREVEDNRGISLYYVFLTYLITANTLSKPTADAPNSIISSLDTLIISVIYTSDRTNTIGYPIGIKLTLGILIAGFSPYVTAIPPTTLAVRTASEYLYKVTYGSYKDI